MSGYALEVVVVEVEVEEYGLAGLRGAAVTVLALLLTEDVKEVVAKVFLGILGAGLFVEGPVTAGGDLLEVILVVVVVLCS